MKRIVVILLCLISLESMAQNYIHVGPAVAPMSAWGAEALGDFKVASLAPKLSLGLGAMAFASTSKTHDEPNPGLRVYRFYAAPQVSLRYAFSDRFDCYLRGGAGWGGNKKEGSGMTHTFLGNAAVGAGLSVGSNFGFYLEAGLPFSSLGVRFSL